MTTHTLRANHGAVWEVRQDPDSGEWVGACERYSLNAIGDTFAEFGKCAAEAMDLLIADLLEEYAVRDQ